MGSVVPMQGPINMISTGFNESHFEFRVIQELYMYGFFSVIIGFVIQQNIGLKTKILSIFQMLSNVGKQNFT